MEITLKIEATGNYTERELNEYIVFLLGVGSCPNENPFVSENGDADLIGAEIQ